MIKVYSYCRKECWHIWKSKNKFLKCLKCKKENIDVQSEEYRFKKVMENFRRSI